MSPPQQNALWPLQVSTLMMGLDHSQIHWRGASRDVQLSEFPMKIPACAGAHRLHDLKRDPYSGEDPIWRIPAASHRILDPLPSVQ